MSVGSSRTEGTVGEHVVILKVLVGSHAHGLATEGSDQDFRSVFVIPTERIFHVGFKFPTTVWSKEHGDEASWEIGQFLFLAIHSHPLVLETFLAPVLATTQWGEALRGLFPAVWSPGKAFEAFTGYALNQRTKFLDKKDGRPAKYAVAQIRVLYNLCELLETGSFTLRIRQTPIGDRIAKIRDGHYRTGEVIDWGEELTERASRSLAACRHVPDWPRVNAFLVDLRRAFLDDK